MYLCPLFSVGFSRAEIEDVTNLNCSFMAKKGDEYSHILTLNDPVPIVVDQNSKSGRKGFLLEAKLVLILVHRLWFLDDTTWW
jgi:hypothetical protein